MARSKDSPMLIRRNKLIVADYEKFCNMKTEKGTEMYRHEYIIEKLGEKYFLSIITVGRILSNRDGDEDSNQITLFEEEK